MGTNNGLWRSGHGVCWCPRCLICVEPEQTQCFVCGYGLDLKDVNAGDNGTDYKDGSGLLEED